MAESVGEVEDSDMEEEDLEPLFADDILDDPPPLPPPMPSLAQLNSSHHLDPTPSSAEAEGHVGDQGPSTSTATDSNDQGPPLKKRKPILTLTVDRIFSDKGLPYLESEFPKLKFKGKGHEVSDLKFLMEQYEHWANRLYPKLTFKDVTQRIERLSTTKEFKNQLLTIRRRHSLVVATPPSHMPEEGADGQGIPPPEETSGNEVNEHNGRITDTEGSPPTQANGVRLRIDHNSSNCSSASEKSFEDEFPHTTRDTAIDDDMEMAGAEQSHTEIHEDISEGTDSL